MAVDTRAKRQSAHRAANGWGWILPHPDATVAAADRAHVEGFYGGLFAAAAAEVDLQPPFGASWTDPARGAEWST